MANTKTKFTVGLFVLLGVLLAAVAVFWIGLSSYLETGQQYVAYFDESVQGLEIDSPVKYRGVSIGRVGDIEVAPDGKLIQVSMRIESKLEPEKNLVAQLKSVGITGIMFVELDQRAEGEPDRSPPLDFTPEHPVIATKPSEIKQLLAGVNEVLQQVREMNLPEISENVRQTLGRLDRAVDDARIDEISGEIRGAVAGFRRIVEDPAWRQIAAESRALIESADRTVSRVDGLIRANEENLASAVEHLNRSLETLEILTGTPPEDPATAARWLEEVQRAAENANTLVERSIELVQGTGTEMRGLTRDIRVSVRALDQAVRNLNRTLEIIADQPSRLFFGEPPPAKPLEQQGP